MPHLPNMTASIPYPSTVLTLDFPGHFHSRRLLLHIPLHQSQAAATPPASKSSHDPAESYAEEASLDANVVMILSILVCAVVCSLALNLIIRCVYRCTRSVASAGGGGDNHPSPKAANKGIKKEVLKTFPTLSYTDGLSRPGLGTECVVCLSEFTAGELVRVLPECNHGFHVHCIDEWLNSHSSCPTCRHCLLPTCPKAAKASQASSPEPPTQPPEHTTISIAPLEPEGLMRDHRNGQHVNEHVAKP